MIFFKDGFVTFFTNLGEKVKITKTKLEESWHTFKGYLSPPPKQETSQKHVEKIHHVYDHKGDVLYPQEKGHINPAEFW